MKSPVLTPEKENKKETGKTKNTKSKNPAKPESANKKELDSYRSLYLAFGKWLIIAVICGALVGVAGAAFGKALTFANDFRNNNRFVIFLLPLAGPLLVLIYKITGLSDDKGTNGIILAARADAQVKFRLAPVIFVSTFMTHFFGGSAGREGAALQIGGSLVSPVRKLLNLDEKDTSTLIMCGMSAGFAALFGTPVAAAVFAIEVTIVGALQYAALVPCMISSVTAVMVSRALGSEAESFLVSGAPSFDSGSAVTVLLVTVLGIAGAVVSVLFCEVMHKAGSVYAKYIANPYLRAAAGGAIVVILTVILGTTDYNGAGMNVIARAFSGEADPLAFLIKIVFTALTLGCGFRGGEIVPSFFVGATLGCTVGGLLGLNPSFGAAVGLISVFCGVTNCPFASLVLSAELFGLNGLPYYALAIAVSYMLSGYSGLYSEQKFYQSKFKPINIFKD